MSFHHFFQSFQWMSHVLPAVDSIHNVSNWQRQRLTSLSLTQSSVTAWNVSRIFVTLAYHASSSSYLCCVEAVVFIPCRLAFIAYVLSHLEAYQRLAAFYLVTRRRGQRVRQPCLRLSFHFCPNDTTTGNTCCTGYVSSGGWYFNFLLRVLSLDPGNVTKREKQWKIFDFSQLWNLPSYSNIHGDG